MPAATAVVIRALRAAPRRHAVAREASGAVMRCYDDYR